jgi:5-methylcytosine-specific restriction endonuclease McrA
MQKQYLNLCIMKNHVHRGHIVQLELKNHSSTTMLQLHLPKCNSYATTLYEYVI